jgi:uncharacterized protein YcbK (DUF882 family)
VSWNRRRLLQVGGLAALSAIGVAARRGGAAPAPAREEPETRRITLKNLHTPESLQIAYRRGGEYDSDALAQLTKLLRDYRTGEEHPMDPALFDYLYEVAHAAKAEPVFSVISGYRSPRTNEMLHERSSGVASKSLHMEGKAIDVRLAGVECAALADTALGMQRGGVGYYRKSDFVHLDTGRFRTWRG